MKKLYMLMIIIFSIFVVSDVKALVLSPSDIEINNFNGENGHGSPALTTINNQYVYTSNVPYTFTNQQRGNMTWIYSYDLSQINEDYVSFVIYGQYINLTATLDNNVCDIKNYSGDWESATNSAGNYNQRFSNWVYSGIICNNTKSSSKLKVNIAYPSATNLVYDNTFLYIDQNVGTWNDKLSYHIEQQTQQQAQQHQDIINDDTSGNASNFSSDISNFNVPNDSHALDILGTLQSFVGNIQVSGACSRISVPIPFTDKNFVLPCMTTDVYSVHFREIVVIWQLICRGVGYYYILVNVLKLVKETLDPFNFKLEVLDL